MTRKTLTIKRTITKSPLPKASAAASGNAEGVHPMGTLSNVERQSELSAGAPRPRQIGVS